MSHPVIVRLFWALAVLGTIAWGPGPGGEPAGRAAAPSTVVASPLQQPDGAPSPQLLVMLTSNVKVDLDDPVQVRILSDYGAVFVAGNGAVPPPAVVFGGAEEVSAWQAGVATRRSRIGRHTVELQAPAMEALLAARAEAREAGLDVTPRGADAARRSYEDTVRLWHSRVEPGLEYWSARRRITAADCARIRRLSPRDQIPEILRLESDGVYFSKDRSKSILYSVAAPGTSQHLSMLALDVNEFESAKVRRILARHGWFQTVVSDLPHFTYLGAGERELPSLGLKKTTSGGRAYWVPDLGAR